MDRRNAIKPTKTKAIQPFSLINYRAMMRENFLHNLQGGFLHDLTKKIEEHEIITRTGLEHALSEAEKSVKSIDLFLADQLKDNSSLENELRTVIMMKRKKEAELDLAVKKMGDLKVDLFKRIESIRETMQCRDFLHKVSRRAWLADYEKLVEKHNLARQPKLDELNKEFDVFMKHMGGMDKEVENIVKEFMEIFQNSGPELVPFNEGKEISGVIKKMEKNNMEMLVHVRNLQKPLAEGRATLNGLKFVYKAEIGEVCRTLKEMTENFTFLKERNARLESIIHDLMKCFKLQVASPDVLKDKALLESLYKSIMGTKKAKPSVLGMWKEIDEAFTDIRCKVGSFSKTEIERRRIGINKLNLKQLSEAEKARNRVLQMEQMVKGVRKSFWAPALPGSKRPMRPRSQPPPAPPASPPPPSPPGEDYTAELEYQSKLVQPLAVSYQIPKPKALRSFFSKRDVVSPDREEDRRIEAKTTEDIGEMAAKEILEIPVLPKVEKFIVPAEEADQY